MKKKLILSVIMICSALFTSCGQSEHTVQQEQTSNVEKNKEESAQQSEEVNLINEEETLKQVTSENNEPIMETVDYSNEFKGIKGCAIIYSGPEDKYTVYNKEMIDRQISPLSTFKIVSTLMGLKYGVIIDEHSTMHYSGNQYPIDAWNGKLSLKEAFQSSCIWYFRQVIDAVGQDAVQEELKALHYGNGDVSEWAGANVNPMEDLNGFWLGSSLKISPMEQTQILRNIFEGSSQFSQSQIEILKEVMLFDTCNGYSLYGKTGSGINGEAWYVGMAEKEDEREYFAVYLEDEKNKEQVKGSLAREILNTIYNTR